MKLSEKTLSLLKNFGSINQSILFKEGNKLRTISVMKNILAEAEIAEDIPQDFGIYDLNQFLNSLSVSQSPELDFSNNQYVMIRGSDTKAKYFFADPSVIVSPPEKEISLPTEDVQFELNTQQLDPCLRTASYLQLPDVSVVGEAGVVKIVVWDKKNDTSDDTDIVGKTDSEFSFNFKVENIKIIPGRYEVTISEKLLSKFTSKDRNLCYYIALEPDSVYK